MKSQILVITKEWFMPTLYQKNYHTVHVGTGYVLGLIFYRQVSHKSHVLLGIGIPATMPLLLTPTEASRNFC